MVIIINKSDSGLFLFKCASLPVPSILIYDEGVNHPFILSLIHLIISAKSFAVFILISSPACPSLLTQCRCACSSRQPLLNPDNLRNSSAPDMMTTRSA